MKWKILFFLVITSSLDIDGQSFGFYTSFQYYYNENYVIHPGPGGLAAFDNIFLPGVSVGFEQQLNKLVPLLFDVELGYSQLGGKYTAGKNAGDQILFHAIQPSFGLKYKFSQRWMVGAGMKYAYLMNSNQAGEVLNRNLFSYYISPQYNFNDKISLEIFIQPFLSPFFKFPFSPLIVDKEYWRLYGIGIKYNFKHWKKQKD